MPLPGWPVMAPKCIRNNNEDDSGGELESAVALALTADHCRALPPLRSFLFHAWNFKKYVRNWRQRWLSDEQNCSVFGAPSSHPSFRSLWQQLVRAPTCPRPPQKARSPNSPIRHHQHHQLYSSKTHNTKAVIENCGQDKLGNSTYNCRKNRHKSIKTIKNKNN